MAKTRLRKHRRKVNMGAGNSAPQAHEHLQAAKLTVDQYVDRAAKLRASRQLHEADAVLVEAAQWFPEDPHLLSEAARVAEWRGDWVAAAQNWHAVHLRLPSQAQAYIGHAQALARAGQYNDAERLLEDALKLFPGNFEILSTRAHCAMGRRDWQKARRYWDKLRTTFPDRIEGHLGSVRARRECGRIDEAEELVASAIERFPSEQRRLHVEYALLAQTRRNWPEAAQRWKAVRAGFADETAAYVLGAVALRELGRLDEAEALLASARERFPNHFGVENQYAWLATIRGDAAEAIERWTVVREHFPDQPVGPVLLARAFREVRRFQDAELVLTKAIERFPADIAILADHAALAEARGDWDSAILRWERLREGAPAEIRGYTHGARALQAAGRPVAAAALLEHAQVVWPENQELLSSCTALAFERRDLDQAILYGRELLRLFPEEPTGFFHTSRALREAGRTEEAAALLRNSPSQFPNNASILSIWASLPMHEQNWSEAALRWRALTEKFPGDQKFLWQYGHALAEACQFDEAEAVLEESMRRFPLAPEVFVAHADVARRRNNPKLALSRLLDAQKRFPNSKKFSAEIFEARLRVAGAQGPLHLEGSLSPGNMDPMHRSPDSMDPMHRSPDSAISAPLVDYAWRATLRRQWAEAVDCWASVRRGYGQFPEAFIRGAQAATELGSLSEAKEILSEGLSRLPHNPELTRYFDAANQSSAPLPIPVPNIIGTTGVSSRKDRALVLIRTHVLNEKIYELLSQVTNISSSLYDVVPLVDMTNLDQNGLLENSSLHSIKSAEDFSLPSKTMAPLLWLCSDYPLYFAHRDFPGYSYYIMIEYDVHFTIDGVAFLQQLVQSLLSHNGKLDAVGLKYNKYAAGLTPEEARRPKNWPYLYPAALAFNEIHYFYFPFIAVSERGVRYLLERRQAEAASGTPPEHVVHCEAFVPSHLVAGGFTCADLNSLMPGSYTYESVSLQARSPVGLPLHCKAITESSSKILHAVYSDREFLHRNIRRLRSDRQSLSSFIDLLASDLCCMIPSELRNEYYALACEGIKMLA